MTQPKVDKTKYRPMCFDCGNKLYLKKRDLTGITISLGTCPECGKKEVGIIPARDWEYRAGEEVMWD